jgi:carbamoylphosphate synthase small subunit
MRVLPRGHRRARGAFRFAAKQPSAFRSHFPGSTSSAGTFSLRPPYLAAPFMSDSATPSAHSRLLILDFGSQYTQVIARRIRECQVYSQIVPFDIGAEEIRNLSPKGIVLSGGPSSVYGKKAPHPSPEIFGLGIPVLGICYGMQLMGHHMGGKVEHSERGQGHEAAQRIPGRRAHRQQSLRGDRTQNQTVLWPAVSPGGGPHAQRPRDPFQLLV